MHNDGQQLIAIPDIGAGPEFSAMPDSDGRVGRDGSDAGSGRVWARGGRPAPHPPFNQWPVPYGSR